MLVTGSAGHLGEALVRTLTEQGRHVVGMDLMASPYTTVVGSITDRRLVARCMTDVDVVLHTATLHKPHLATHSRQAFLDTNVSGTLTLLEEAVRAGIRAFVFTSTTSAFGSAMRSAEGEPAVWVTEDLVPVPRNMYGASKIAAEDLCRLIHLDRDLPVIILRTGRFFAESDDDPGTRARYPDANVKVNEYLYRRVDLQDVVDAHLLAADRAESIGFGRYVISATTPFAPADVLELGRNAPEVVRRLFPDYEAEYDGRGWEMFPRIDRVYDNALARNELGWEPVYDFRRVLDNLKSGEDVRSPIARQVGAKGYTGADEAYGT